MARAAHRQDAYAKLNALCAEQGYHMEIWGGHPDALELHVVAGDPPSRVTTVLRPGKENHAASRLLRRLQG